MQERSRRGPYEHGEMLQIQPSQYEVGLPENFLLCADFGVACLAAVLDPGGALVFYS